MVIDIVLPAVLGPAMRVRPETQASGVVGVYTGSCSESGHRSLMRGESISVASPVLWQSSKRGVDIRRTSLWESSKRRGKRTGYKYRRGQHTVPWRLWVARCVAWHSPVTNLKGLVSRSSSDMAAVCVESRLCRCSGGGSMGVEGVGGGEVKDHCRWSD